MDPASGAKPLSLGELVVMAAVYGIADVTEQVHDLYSKGVKEIHAENEIFGDTWPGVAKTLQITYRIVDFPRTKTIKEHETVAIPDG